MNIFLFSHEVASSEKSEIVSVCNHFIEVIPKILSCVEWTLYRFAQHNTSGLCSG